MARGSPARHTPEPLRESPEHSALQTANGRRDD